MLKRLSVVTLAAALCAACSEASAPVAQAPLTQGITFNAFQGTLGQLPAGAVARVRIALGDTSPIAAALMVKASEETGAPERVDGAVRAIAPDASGDGATLTLAPGVLVHVSANTPIEREGAHLAFQDFVATVQGDLAAMPPVLPRVEVRRATVSPPLGADDAFPAERVELVSDGAGADVRVNITSANLLAVGSGDCAQTLSATLIGCIQVVGLTVGIDSTTRLDEMRQGAVETEFSGTVACPSLVTTDSVTGSFDLAGEGVHILVDSATFTGRQGDAEDGDGGGDGGDGHDGRAAVVGLAGLGAACAAGDTVHARGEGVPDAADPSSIRATEVRFSLTSPEDDGDGGDGGEHDAGEVLGAIDSVVAPNVYVAGHVVVTDSATEIRRGDATITLADLAVGDSVKVDGTAQADGSILAREIDVQSAGEDGDANAVEFDGVIDSLAAPVLVVSGRAVITNDSTEFNDDGAITFGDLRVGEDVEVRGIARSDSSVLARRIDVKH